MKAKLVTDTKVITALVRLSYLHVWEPKASEEGGKPKYQASLIIPKSDKETLKIISQAVENAKKAGMQSKFGGKLGSNFGMPLRDGDEDRPEDEAYADSMFINCSSFNKPQIVDKNLDPITDHDELYSGCFARVSINLFPYNSNGKKGIGCGLNNIQKIKDGDPLGGVSRAEDDFDVVKVDNDDDWD